MKLEESHALAQAQAVAAWLQSLPHHKGEQAHPIELTIRDSTWVGALYCLPEPFGASERATTEGPMQAGEIRRSYRLYLLGEYYQDKKRKDQWLGVYDLPVDKRAPLERCYTHSDEWYVATYLTPGRVRYNDDRSLAATNLFGACWIMILHQTMNFGYYKDWKIDTGEQRPYLRLPMTVRYL